MVVQQSIKIKELEQEIERIDFIRIITKPKGYSENYDTIKAKLRYENENERNKRIQRNKEYREKNKEYFKMYKERNKERRQLYDQKYNAKRKIKRIVVKIENST